MVAILLLSCRRMQVAQRYDCLAVTLVSGAAPVCGQSNAIPAHACRISSMGGFGIEEGMGTRTDFQDACPPVLTMHS